MANPFLACSCAGDSGGPILNARGRQIGVISWVSPLPNVALVPETLVHAMVPRLSPLHFHFRVWDVHVQVSPVFTPESVE